jgi:hypothetical protein
MLSQAALSTDGYASFQGFAVLRTLLSVCTDLHQDPVSFASILTPTHLLRRHHILSSHPSLRSLRQKDLFLCRVLRAGLKKPAHHMCLRLPDTRLRYPIFRGIEARHLRLKRGSRYRLRQRPLLERD